MSNSVPPALLDVNGLMTEFVTADGMVRAVDGVSYRLHEGQTIGIVGESGSGKSVSVLSLLRLVPHPGRIVAGTVLFAGVDLLKLPRAAMRQVRGSKIGMIFQDPSASLNPVMRIGRQIGEALEVHRGLSREAARRRAIELLDLVEIPAASSRVDDYPHTFSGGMRQRIMIALALSCDPKLLIADEPTTALDATVQAQILELLRRIQEERQMAMILVTHDVSIAAGMTDQIQVMYAGHIVETATPTELFTDARHPYTLGLLRSVIGPDDGTKTKLVPIPGSPPHLMNLPAGCPFAPRCTFVLDRCRREIPPLDAVVEGEHRAACWIDVKRSAFRKSERRFTYTASPPPSSDILVEVRNLKTWFPVRHGRASRGRRSWVRAVDDATLSIRRGETLGLVGESGSGKTTLGRTVLRLERPTSGQVRFRGNDITHTEGSSLRRIRREMQVIFQDPYGSLDPRLPVEKIIAEPLAVHRLARGRERLNRVDELLGLVGLSPASRQRYPHEFSGGQRQRIAIARALAMRPSFVVCDEPVSSLDVSIRAQIINLLMDLQSSLGLTYLFIAHDLALVRHIAQRVAVMYLGKIVEVADTETLFRRPLHPYTQALLSAIPASDPLGEQTRERIVLHGDIPSPISPPTGCRFRTRCPFAQQVCSEVEPELMRAHEDHSVSCHFWSEIENGAAVGG